MAELFAGWRFALLRLTAQWRLLALLAFGVLLAATLLAAAPVYADAMSALGLRFRLERELSGGVERVAFVAVDGLGVDDPVDRRRRAAIDAVTEAHVGWLAPELVTEERSRPLLASFPAFEQSPPLRRRPVVAPEDAPFRQPWVAYLYALSELEEHVEVTAGRLPGPAAGGAEVVLPDGFRRHAAVGDEIALGSGSLFTDARPPPPEFPYDFDDCPHTPAADVAEIGRDEVACSPTAFVSSLAMATIVGFVRPLDAADPRWELFSGGWDTPAGPPLLDDQAAPGSGSLTLLTTGEQLFGPFARRLPQLSTQHTAGLVPDLAALTTADVTPALDALAAWRADIEAELALAPAARFPLAGELARFRNDQTFTQVQLLLILLQVVGVVLYYIVMVAAMLLERQAEQLSVLRSRGASTAQLLGLSLVEGLVLAVPAVLLAPALAATVVATLGRAPTFDAVTGGAPLPAGAGPDAYLLAAGGAALALAAMLLPAWFAARRSVAYARRKQARPPARAVLQRYYVDLGVVGLAVVLWWQLDRRGSVFDPDVIGGWSGDPLLLLSPLVFTLAVAALLLRFYPPLLRLAVRVLLAAPGTAVAIGLRRAGRAPATYARLLLLLVMAVSVGTFAASYGPTVERSFDERLRYAIGADLRGEIVVRNGRSLDEQLAAVRSLDGVSEAAVAFRGTIGTPGTPGGGSLQLLGIDPARGASLLWSREDFAAQPLAELLGRLDSAVPAGGGLPLPPGATELQVHVFTDGPLGRERIWARFLAGDGAYFRASLTRPDGEGWSALRARLPSGRAEPLQFVGLEITDGRSLLREGGSLYLDDLTAVTAGGTRVVIEDFEARFGWTLYPERALEETFEPSTEQALSGDRAARWTWSPATSPRQRVIAPADPTVPLAALMNGPALSAFRAEPGGIARATLGEIVVPLAVRGAVELFPTLDPDGGMVIVNLDQLRAAAGVVGFEPPLSATELWVALDDALTIEQQQAIGALLSDEARSPLLIAPRARVLAAELAEVAADPTRQAAGSGILLMASAAMLAVAVAGFAVTLALGAQRRGLESAVLRAVGTSPRQLLVAMLLEWGAVLALGVAIGVLLGRRVAAVMLSFLDVTEQGARVLPPFIVGTDWTALGLGVLVLGLVVLAAITLSWTVLMRGASASQLRRTL